jgi:hypothetical protein
MYIHYYTIIYIPKAVETVTENKPSKQKVKLARVNITH